MKKNNIKIWISALLILTSTIMFHGRAQASPNIDWEAIAKFGRAYDSFKGQLESLQDYAGSLHSCVCFTPPSQSGDPMAKPARGEQCDLDLKDQLEKDLLKAFEASFSKVLKGGDFYQSALQFTQGAQGILQQNQYICSDKMEALADLQKAYNLTALAYLLSPDGNGSDSDHPNTPSPHYDPNLLQALPRPNSNQEPNNPQQPNSSNEPQGPLGSAPSQPSAQTTSDGGNSLIDSKPQAGPIVGGCSIGSGTKGPSSIWAISVFVSLLGITRFTAREKRVR